MGRISRISRRVNAGGLVTERVMTRALMSYQRHFTHRVGPASTARSSN